MRARERERVDGRFFKGREENGAKVVVVQEDEGVEGRATFQKAAAAVLVGNQREREKERSSREEAARTSRHRSRFI